MKGVTVYFCILLISFEVNGQADKNEILNTTVDKMFCFRSADKELDKLAKTYQLKINFNQDRLAKYSIEKDFHNDKISYVLQVICRTTKSRYFITGDNTIYIIGRHEKFSPEVESAIMTYENQEQKREIYEEPKKFNLTVTGKILDASSDEPLPNVSITIIGKNGGTTSNMDGYFTIQGVPNDTAIIEFTNIGYQISKYFLSPNKPADSLHVRMVSTKSSLSEVVVTAKRTQTFKLNQKVSMIKMTPALIATLPSVGEKDIFRSFQLMPGISAANENTSGLYVRGGTPDQSLVLFDGFTVYNVEHLFGFFSAFNSNAIKDVQLFKGGFEPKYGGRLSSVVDIAGKEGNKNHFNAGADLSLMSANVFAEGPVGKKVTGIFSFRKSFRTSLYDKIFNKYSDENKMETPQNVGGRPNPFGTSSQKTKSFFYDVNAKFTWKPTEKDVFSWSMYSGKDNLDNSIIPQIPSFFQNSGRGFGIKITDITLWGNTGSSLKWSRRWDKRLFSNTLISYSNYFSNRDRSSDVTRTDDQGNETTFRRGTLEDNDLKDYSVKTDLEYKAGKNHQIETGYHITLNDIKYSYAQNDTSKLIDRDTKGMTYTAYLQDRVSLFNSKVQIIPGIRTTYFSPTKKMYYEPRINFTYDISDKLKLKGSAGRYNQFAKRVIREDVLQGSRDFWVLADNNKLTVASSDQLVAGVSWENREYLIDVEAYYKKLKGLSEYSLRFELRPGQISYQENFFEGTGYTKGIDILLQKKFGDYTGWVGYTLGETLSNYPVYGEKDFYASNDVRHEFKTVHVYKWQKFDFSATFILATGRAYTAPSGGYSIELLDGSSQSFINVSDKNANRLPTYHRFDAGITYNFGEPNRSNGTIGLSLFNIYNRKNVWYKNYEVENNSVIETDVYYLGFTPNLTFTYRFK